MAEVFVHGESAEMEINTSTFEALFRGRVESAAVEESPGRKMVAGMKVSGKGMHSSRSS